MPITRQTLRLSDELRVVIAGNVGRVTRDLVEAWVRAWEQIEDAWAKGIDDLVEASVDGRWPDQSQILRASRAQRALEVARREIIALADFAGVTVVTSLPDVVGPAAAWQARLIASQLPPVAGDQASLAVGFDRVSADAIGAIVERSTEQITARTRFLEPHATEAMRQTLIRGVAIGDNPRTAARLMLRRAEGVFNGGLTRALGIARTEMLDAYRSGAAAGQFANADVLAGWVWTAQLDSRTCPSCWSMHGSEHPLDEMGPSDHQQGRCARVPKIKTWRELGFNLAEPVDLLPDARRVFAALPEATKLTIMGPARLHALNAGTASWSDLSMVRSTTGWRDSHVPRPARELRRPLRVVR